MHEQERFNALKAENEIELLNRRKRLADLYNSEMDEWKRELLSKMETQEDRKARIMERAYALRDAREKARAEFVAKCYDAQVC